MAKKETAAPATKKKGSKAITVFNIIFLVVSILGLLVGIAAIVVKRVPSLHDMITSKPWFTDFANYMVNWVKRHLVENLGLTFPFHHFGPSVTAFMYAYLYATMLFALLFLCYIPFLVMNHNRKVSKTAGFRKGLCWFVFVVTFLVFIGYLSITYTQYISKLVGPWYTWFPNAYATWKSYFAPGGILSVLNLNFITPNPWVNSTIYILVMLVVFQTIFHVMAVACKSKKEAAIKAAEEKALADKAAEEAAANEPVVTPVPVLAVEEKPEEKKERIIPTIRELALLNSLEPIEFSPVSNLPGLYDTDVEKLIELLEQQISTELSDIEVNCKDVIEAKKISEAVEPKIKFVECLPGIDEWGANPWSQEETVIEPVVECLPGINEWGANPWSQEETVKEEKPAEPELVVEPKPQPEPEPEVVIAPVAVPIEPTKESVAEEKVEEVVEPEPQPEPEPEVKTSREEFKKVICDNTHEEVNTVKYGKANEWILPEYIPGQEPVFEEEKKPEPKPEVKPEPKVEEKKSREDAKTIVLDNSHEEVKTIKYAKANEWILPEYVEEPEKLAEPEVKEEPKVEPVKPVANVKQVELKQMVPPVRHENKPKIVPIAPVVAKEPEPVVEEPVEEKKIPAPISGPLHSTEKSRHEKIEVVKAKKVKFELQNYKIKTYQGDISAEEAFAMGVTKVQPTVNPVFANQANEPEWKQRRRDQDIRKNGYVNVQKVEKLDGAAPAPVSGAATPVTSIRDMVKAQKANEVKEEAVEKKEENKIAKPVAPIALKPVAPVKPSEPVEKKKVEKQNPFSDKPVPAFHPIAPINKKETKRPTIKPVDPFKKK